jgi:cytochrome P450
LPGIGAACLRSEMDRIRDGMRGGVSVRRVAFTTALNLLSCTIFSDDLADLDDRGASGEFMAVIEEFPMAVGAPNLSDFFPAIAPLDPQRIRARLVRVFKKLHAIFDEQIERRVQERAAGDPPKNDFLDLLLDYRGAEDDRGFDRQTLLSLLTVTLLNDIQYVAKLDKFIIKFNTEIY